MKEKDLFSPKGQSATRFYRQVIESTGTSLQHKIIEVALPAPVWEMVEALAKEITDKDGGDYTNEIETQISMFALIGLYTFADPVDAIDILKRKGK